MQYLCYHHKDTTSPQTEKRGYFSKTLSWKSFHAKPLSSKRLRGVSGDTNCQSYSSLMRFGNVDSEVPIESPINQVVFKIRKACGLRPKEHAEGLHLGALSAESLPFFFRPLFPSVEGDSSA